MQAALANAIIASAASVGNDAVFLDDAVAQGNGYASTTPALYGSQAAWEDAMVSALQNVGSRIRAQGLHVIANTYKRGSQLGTSIFAERFAGAVTGIMFEGNDVTPWYAFEDALAAFTYAQNFTDVFVLSYSDPDDAECNTSVGQFLSVWDGDGGAHVLFAQGNDGWGTWAAALGAA
jgi:hypothetical protein